MFRIAFIISFCAFAFSGVSQELRGTKVPLSFYYYADQIPEGEMIHLYAKGEPSVLTTAVNDAGGLVKRIGSQFMAISIPKESFEAFADHPDVESIHLELGKGMPLLNESRIHTRIDRVHDGTAGLISDWKGEGVIIGVIDAGLDLSHPDFLDADSNTRVLEIWDQTMGYSATRTPSYGYGQVYDSADINANNCPHIDQPAYYGHGTNTTGIAAGNGLADVQYTGCAPMSELLVVSSNFNSLSWTATVADAVDYILDRADYYGKPCVINASLGTYAGSHDGRDAATREIVENITSASGQAMVCAAGNSGDEHPYHLGYEVESDTNFTWFKTSNNASIGSGVIFYEVFGDVNDMEGIKFSIGADQVEPTYHFRGQTPFDSIENRLYSVVTDSLFSTSGSYLARVQTWADSLNGTYRLQVYINNIDSIDYNFRFSTTGSGRFDLWSTTSGILNLYDMVYEELPSNSTFPDILNYKLPDSKQQIVSNWACAEEVITVGNYTNRNEYVDVDENIVEFSTLTPGAIAASSSAGPSRLGSVKPDVTAPGELTITAGAEYQIAAQLANINQRDRVGVGGLHHRAGGTSSASPVVAGIAALFFESCPNSNWEDFKEAITSGAVEDEFTGSGPSDRWGYGKADAQNALQYHLPYAEVTSLNDEFCEGASVVLNLDGNYSNVIWSTGAQSSSVLIEESGQYFAVLRNELGCQQHSDTMNVFERPIPESPKVLVEGANPGCEGVPTKLSIETQHGSYNWNNGLTTQSVLISDSGLYWCLVQNQYGCEANSDTIDLRFHENLSDPLLHHKADDILSLEHSETDSVAYKWYQGGIELADELDSTYKVTSPGFYYGSVVDHNGCEWVSDGVDIGSLDIRESTAQDLIAIYPNPTENALNIISGQVISKITLVDATGRVLLTRNPASQYIDLDVAFLTPGVYFINTYDETTWSQKRFIKQ